MIVHSMSFHNTADVVLNRMATPEAFANTCRDLLERMINTVPKGVTLSEVIKPLPVKVDGVQLSVAEDSLRFQVMLRVSTYPSTPHYEQRLTGVYLDLP